MPYYTKEQFIQKFLEIRKDYNYLKENYDNLVKDFDLLSFEEFQKSQLLKSFETENDRLKCENDTLKERLKRRMRRADDNEPECCVCYSATQTKTDCGHLVCMKCIRKLDDDKCPYCRTPL